MYRQCILWLIVLFSAFPLGAQEPIAKPTLKDVPPSVLAGIKARVLDLRSIGPPRDFWLADHGQLAVAIEQGKDKSERYALWDLNTGKLVRYLSAHSDKGTTPYTGEDDDDFGTVVDFPAGETRRFTFSTDGKYIAALTQLRGVGIPGVRPLDEIVIWERDTGKQIRRVLSASHHEQTFFFLDGKQLIAKGFTERGAGIEQIDVTNGSVNYLMEPAGFEMYAGAARDGQAAFQVPGGMRSIDVESKEQTHFTPRPGGGSRLAADRMWFSTDGRQLFVRKGGTVEVWDAEKKTFLRDWKLPEDGESYDLSGVAVDANLMAVINTKTKQVGLIDLNKGQLVTTVMTPFAGVTLSGISRDGKRLVFGMGDRKVLVVDFPEGAPEGQLDLTELAKKAQNSPLR